MHDLRRSLPLPRRPASRPMLAAAALFAAAGLPPACAAAAAVQTLTIEEPFGLAWGPDRIVWPVDFPEGAVTPGGASLKDAGGQPVAVQLTDVVLWADGRTVRTASAVFMVRLAPGERGQWTLAGGAAPAVQPDTGLRASTDGRVIELVNDRTGIRLAGGAETFAEPAAAEAVPAPIQAVRLHDGEWIGRGWWQTDVGCTGYSAELVDAGPVVARVRLRYTFEGGRAYEALVELAAGQDLAVVTEEFNLSEGQRYPMSGVDGMSADQLYAYVPPSFDSPDQALIWDWWGQTMAVLPTPNAYFFSLHDGLRPDSADFYGRNVHDNLRQGDGGLTYERDGRIAYLNAFLQWGDEEALYLGLYNAGAPARQVAVVALRPSQWVHPDIEPHPSAILRQYVQTNCITFERRRAGDVFFRAPTCLGRRVYGLGGVERTLAVQDRPERQGPVATAEPAWGSNLMLRHVRMGRLELDTVRRWTLDYEEPSAYPRMFVPPGDRVRYESRRTRRPLEEVRQELAGRTDPTAADVAAVQAGLDMARTMVRHFARSDYGNMDYGIREGLLSAAAEDALASPACSPEQAKEIRRHLAAIVYNALHPDFAPPREAGFAWGSANMMAQVQCRAAGLAALLPNHPDGRAWRERLARLITLYVESQINEAGATLECPHYGSMAIVMPVHALTALAHCGDVDLTRAERRLRAAAHQRLACLLPYDPRGGFRPVMTSGDGYYGPDSTLAPLAGFFQQRDARLAGQLAWGVRESGNDLGGHSDPSYKLFDPGLEPIPPELGSEHFPGYGFVMRRGFPARDETHLQVLAGSFSWGHGHNDRGCWTLYARGVPLMVDFAAMYTPSMREQWLHPGGLTFHHDETVRPAGDDPTDAWWRADPSYKDLALAPFTAVEMRPDPTAGDDLGRFGAVTAFHAGARADFAEMRRRIRYLQRVPYALSEPHGKDVFMDMTGQEVWLREPFEWTRRFVLVKDPTPAGRDYAVVRDELPGNTELDPYLNLWALADALEVNGPHARYTGQHGVDLLCYVAEPAAFTPLSRTVGHPCGFGFARHYKETFGKDFREDQILCRIPQSRRDGGFFIGLFPIAPDEEAPAVETVLDGRGLRVAFADRVDTVVLQRDATTVEVGGRTAHGRSLLFTTAGGQTTAIVLGE